MKLEVLAGIWNSTDMELQKSIKINKDLVKTLGIKKIRSGLYEIKFNALVGIIVGIIFSIFLWRFIFRNMSAAIFLWSAVILLLITIFTVSTQLYRIVLIYTLDASSPVIDSRKKLMQIKKMEIIEIYSLYVVIPLYFAPFMIVASKAFLNINLYTIAGSWLLYSSLASILIASILVFFLKKIPNKKLASSIDFLNELKEEED